MSTKTNLAFAAALTVFASLAQQAAAGVNDPGQVFVDRVSGSTGASTVAGSALPRSSDATRLHPSDFYGLFGGSPSASDAFERTQGQGMGERAGGASRY